MPSIVLSVYFCAAIILFPAVVAVGQDDDYVVFSSNGLDVLFVPDEEPLLDGALLGGTLAFRAAEDTSSFTFRDISLDNLHHAGISFGDSTLPTVSISDHFDDVNPIYDSHVLITPEMIIWTIGPPLQELNFDVLAERNPTGLENSIPENAFGFPSFTYTGDIIGVDGEFGIEPTFTNGTIEFARLVGRVGTVSPIQIEVVRIKQDNDLRIESGIMQFDIPWGVPADGSPPNLELGDLPSPVEGRITLTATASDNDGEIREVLFYHNGYPIERCRFTAGPFECSGTPLGRTGIREFSVRARDDSGLLTYAEKQVLVVTPVLGFLEPDKDLVGPDFVTPGDTVLFDVFASDISRVEFFAIETNSGEVEAIPNCVDFEAPFTCEWTTPLDRGNYQVDAIAYDSQNETRIATRYFDVGDLPPFVEFLSPPEDRRIYVGESVQLSANARDSNGAVVVEFFANNEPIPGCRLTTSPYECSWAPVAGDYQVIARATDIGGSSVDSEETGRVRAFPPGVGGIDTSIIDENGAYVVDIEIKEITGFEVPIPLTEGFGAVFTSIEIPVQDGGPVILVGVEELSDIDNVFEFEEFYFGELPRRFETFPMISIGFFVISTEFAGSFDASYLLSFEGGIEVQANLTAIVAPAVPEPSTSIGLLIGAIGVGLSRRPKPRVVLAAK